MAVAWADCGDCRTGFAASSPVSSGTVSGGSHGYWARTVRVEPVRLSYQEPIDVVDCRREKGSAGTVGAVVGAVAGGVAGSAVGAGAGRRWAIAGGALAGGAIGQAVARQDGKVVCGQHTVVRQTRAVVLYDVVYHTEEGEAQLRTDTDPGAWVWVDTARR